MKQLTSALIDRLKSLDIFSAHSESEQPQFHSEELSIGVAYDLSGIFQQFLFIWHEQKQSVLAIDLELDNSRDGGIDYQTLVPAARPLGTVRQLLVSPAGQRLALLSAAGVTIVQLPPRWGASGLFDGGKQTVSCASRHLAERFFLCSGQMRVTSARWHPESSSDSHLVLLTSDNYLRVYDVSADLQTPCHVVPLGATSSASLGADSSFVRSLGETAVAFTFAPRPLQSQSPDADPVDDAEPLPVFILRGNGGIYTTCISLSQPRERYSVAGPVPMQPAADDNYGADACDLLCLPSCPPVLVVAAPSRLYHCVVLSRTDDDPDQDACSEGSWSRYSAGFCREPASVSLYVYESVEPDLMLAPGDTADTEPGTIRLHPDPTASDRYFCSHAAGVHAVLLPLVAALERFTALPDGSDEPLGEHACIVEHLVCTRAVASAPVCPVLGLTVIPHPLIMTALLATREMVLLPLLSRYRPSTAPQPAADTEHTASPQPAQDVGEPFEVHVRRLLERTSSVPLLRAGPSSQPAPLAERLELLRSAAARLRTEYIHRQQVARHAVQLRTSALAQQLQQQRRDAAQLQLQQAQLLQRAQQATDRLAQVRQTQEQLKTRGEAAYRRCQRGLPVLSDAERGAAKELKELGDLETLQNRLYALRDKLQYQRKQRSVERVNAERRDRELACLSAAQRELLLTELRAQGDQIAALLATAQSARKTLQL